VHDGADAAALARNVAERLRDAGMSIVVNAGGGSMKSQMKRADASAARYALIIGQDEASTDTVAVKPLRESGEQFAVPALEVARRLLEMCPHARGSAAALSTEGERSALGTAHRAHLNKG